MKKRIFILNQCSVNEGTIAQKIVLVVGSKNNPVLDRTIWSQTDFGHFEKVALLVTDPLNAKSYTKGRVI